jgi:coronin-7
LLSQESPLTGEEWLGGKTVDVSKVSLDPKRVAYIKKNTVQQSNAPQANNSTLTDKKVAETPKPEEKAPATTTTTPVSTTTSTTTAPVTDTAPISTTTSNPTPQVSSSNDSNEVVQQNSANDSIKSTPSTSTTKSDENKVNNDISSPKQEEVQKETIAAPVKKVLPKFGAANASVYKYISGKTYHPRTHYEDLRGLSIDKSGTCDLIQASRKLIAVPISGPGGRVGIIDANKPGRLPTHIPCVLCGSEVTSFKFDPFNPLRLLTGTQN